MGMVSSAPKCCEVGGKLRRNAQERCARIGLPTAVRRQELGCQPIFTPNQNPISMQVKAGISEGRQV